MRPDRLAVVTAHLHNPKAKLLPVGEAEHGPNQQRDEAARNPAPKLPGSHCERGIGAIQTTANPGAISLIKQMFPLVNIYPAPRSSAGLRSPPLTCKQALTGYMSHSKRLRAPPPHPLYCCSRIAGRLNYLLLFTASLLVSSSNPNIPISLDMDF